MLSGGYEGGGNKILDKVA